MKYSQFNNHFFYEQKYIWFNSFSNEFLILEPILHDLLQSSINEKNPLELKKIHQDFYDALLSKKFIVDKFVNEIELVREWNKKLIEDDNLNEVQQFIREVSANDYDVFAARIEAMKKEFQAYIIKEKPHRKIGFNVED